MEWDCFANNVLVVHRGDLENERVKKEYERGYQTLLDFYHKYL